LQFILTDSEFEKGPRNVICSISRPAMPKGSGMIVSFVAPLIFAVSVLRESQVVSRVDVHDVCLIWSGIRFVVGLGLRFLDLEALARRFGFDIGCWISSPL